MNTLKFFTLIWLFFCTTACSTIRGSIMPDEDNLMSGAGSIAVTDSKAKQFEELDISELKKDYGLTSPKDIRAADINADTFKYKRNELQDRIIAASNQRCGMYLRVLTTSKAQTQLGWGILATMLSGAASVVTHTASAQAFAAGSTVSSGILSQYNEAYFNNLALNVISSGISKQREGLILQINKKRNHNLIDYPVNRAVADALSYHAACNIVTGLETAAVATRAANAELDPSSQNIAQTSGSTADGKGSSVAQVNTATTVPTKPKTAEAEAEIQLVPNKSTGVISRLD